MPMTFKRLIIGLAGGAYTVVPNIYIAECAEADIRGDAQCVKSCVKHSCQVPRITFEMFRCQPQKCIMAKRGICDAGFGVFFLQKLRFSALC